MEIQGKVFIVTGGASGLGEGTARMLAAHGAKVIIADMQQEKGLAVANTIGGIFVPCDVSSEADGQAVVQQATRAGMLAGLVNCAGIAPAEKTVGKSGAHSLALYQKVIQVNLIGSFNMIRLAAEAMSKNTPESTGERGVIISTASIAAYDGQIGQAAYAASKGGVVGMTLPIARDLARNGIRNMTIAPGIFGTPMLFGMPQEVQDALAAGVPFPSRLGTPEDYAKLVKQAVPVPVFCAGRMDDPDLAAQALRDGRCDMIGLARPLLTDPDYVRKVRNDELALIRPCLCCHEGCFGRAFDGAVGSCAVNPECARERLVGIAPAAEKKRVVVVGGGPAGLEAARVSALRGHDVTLLEASDALGGALKPAGVPHFKQADRDLVAWYAATLAHLGVDVRLNTRADKALLDSLKPQTVFVAEGSTPRTLALPGADGDNVVSALDVLEGKAKAGKSVVIIGAGLVACELALHLVQNGHTVTLLARRKLLRSAKLPAMNELMLRDLLVFHGVHIVEGAALESVDAKGVYYEVEGVPALAEGDTVITAVGMEANHALFDAIRDDYETVLALGDGRRVRNIFGAIWDGYEAARSL